MRLLEVNGVSLLGATHQEAVDVLRAGGNELHLIVCKGYNKSDLLNSVNSLSIGGRLGKDSITYLCPKHFIKNFAFV